MSNIPPEWIALFVASFVVAIGNKIWNRLSVASQQRIESAVEAISSVIRQVVFTAAPNMTVDKLIPLLQGVAKDQLDKLGMTSDHPAVVHLVNLEITRGVTQFIGTHPAPQTLDLPILKKITPPPAVAAVVASPA